jgi:hypothetical protein
MIHQSEGQTSDVDRDACLYFVFLRYCTSVHYYVFRAPACYCFLYKGGHIISGTLSDNSMYNMSVFPICFKKDVLMIK